MLMIDGTLGEYTETADMPDPWWVGLPPLGNATLPPCGAWPLCSREREKALANNMNSTDCDNRIHQGTEYHVSLVSALANCHLL
jgi:hypothetical protein